jgi:hypothetical protein
VISGDNMVPSSKIAGGSNVVEMVPSGTLRLDGLGFASACFPNATLGYSWDLYSGSDIGSRVKTGLTSSSLNKRKFSLRPYSLQPLGVYTLCFQVSQLQPRVATSSSCTSIFVNLDVITAIVKGNCVAI